MNIQMSFFYGEYLTTKKKMGALCSHLFLVVSGSVHSVHVFVNGIKRNCLCI